MCGTRQQDVKVPPRPNRFTSTHPMEQPCPQRKPNQRQYAQAGTVSGRPAADQYRIRLRGTAERVCPRAAATGQTAIDVDDVFDAITGVHRRCRGAYAAIAMITGYGVLAFRDPCGIRPLVFGKRETENGTEYIAASESVALDVLGFDLIRDVAPGEAVFFGLDDKMHARECADKATLSPCLFEYVYLARPDSIIDDVSVYKARLRMGDKLPNKIQRVCPDYDIDVVIPIPDTSRTSALQLANNLGLKYREGFIKNRYIGRTFIMPGQKQRKKSVRQKLGLSEFPN